jgi:two-component system, cell cycle sensor histidine kinase and response regulator CckA
MSVQNQNPAETPNERSLNQSHLRNTVLVVDDTSDRLDLMATILRQAGYRVLTARDGQEGFELASRELPDLIVSDVSMPRVDGIKLCRMIREHEELGLMPVLLVSALRKDTTSIVEGLQSGAFDYLEAPYDPKHLVAKVERLVELSETERALREREELYRELVENARDIIYTHNLTGRFTSLNRAGEQITGYSREEALTMTITDVIAPEYMEEALQMVTAKHAEGGQTIYSLEIIAKDGHRVALEINSRPLYENGAVAGIQGIARDVTERKSAEEALREKEEQLRQSQKLEAVGQLAGGVAHDFNNLLTVITGYSDLVLRRFSHDDPARPKVEEIKRAAERAADLTRQLLAFSRKQVLQPKVININELVTNVVKMLGRLVGENIELIPDLRKDVGQVNADPGQMEQVLMNLMLNARDALRQQGGKIIVETANVELDKAYVNLRGLTKPGHYVMLAVSDNGYGIDAETQKHIFEPFFTTKESGKGTGLGLSTVYGIVKQSGGFIWVYSEKGGGTTFKVYLPRIEGEVEVLQTSEGILRDGTETILLVEDDTGVRTLIRTTLEERGYHVLEAANCDEALDIISNYQRQIHLMLTDVVMPKMNGRDLADRVQKMHPEVRVLFMSGYTDEAIVHHGVLDSDTPFLEKPFTLDKLSRKIREVLDAEN